MATKKKAKAKAKAKRAKKPAKKPRAKPRPKPRAKPKPKPKPRPKPRAKPKPAKPPIPRALDAVEQAQRAASGVTSTYLNEARRGLLRALGSTVAASKPRKKRPKRSTTPDFAGF